MTGREHRSFGRKHAKSGMRCWPMFYEALDGRTFAKHVWLQRPFWLIAKLSESLWLPSIFRCSANHAACSIRHSRMASIFSSRKTASRLSSGHVASISADVFRSPLAANRDTKKRQRAGLSEGHQNIAMGSHRERGGGQDSLRRHLDGDLNFSSDSLCRRERVVPSAPAGYGSASGRGGNNGKWPSRASDSTRPL